MKKARAEQDEPMAAEYQLRGGVRGRHFRSFREGYTVRVRRRDGTTEVRHYAAQHDAVFLDRDVRAYFPDSVAVNEALRTLIRLRPRKPARRSIKTASKTLV